jgi:SAM-dependent methyltransferase
MSEGFSAQWLALREPADHAARDAGLRDLAAKALAGHETQNVVDLGCGAGSNLRGLAPALGPRQRWTLVDHDPALLAAAKDALTAWGDAATLTPEGLRLEKAGKRIEVRFRRADLAADPASALEEGTHLVTAAALFDLVSQRWAERFADALVARRLPFYTILIYDGVERWSPGHPLDAAALAAFHAHQAGDKGFGPALGPKASQAFADLFAARGYDVRRVSSPWRIGQDQAALLSALAEGGAEAVRQTGRLAPQEFEAWRAARLASTRCEIGHEDVFAVPRR